MRMMACVYITSCIGRGLGKGTTLSCAVIIMCCHRRHHEVEEGGLVRAWSCQCHKEGRVRVQQRQHCISIVVVVALLLRGASGGRGRMGDDDDDDDIVSDRRHIIIAIIMCYCCCHWCHHREVGEGEGWVTAQRQRQHINITSLVSALSELLCQSLHHCV